MIEIRKSETADTRTCDWSQVTKEQLLASSKQHIDDVDQGLMFFKNMLKRAALWHDFDKVTDEGIELFHKDFQTGFKETGWYDNHRKVNRHHLNAEDGIPEDVTLIDVIEYITDCTMAGLARSGNIYDITIPDELLQKAFANTAALLKSNVKIIE